MAGYLLCVWLSFCFFSPSGWGENLKQASRSKACQRAVHKAVSSEKKLEREGFDSKWTHGLDELEQDWIPLANELREKKADPIKTHIPQFAERIPQHIQFALRRLGRTNNRLLNMKRLNPIINKEEKKRLDFLTSTQGYKDFISQYPEREWDLKYAYLRYKLIASWDNKGESKLKPKHILLNFKSGSDKEEISAGVIPRREFKILEREREWRMPLEGAKRVADYYLKDIDLYLARFPDVLRGSALLRLEPDERVSVYSRDGVFYQQIDNLFQLADFAAQAVKNKEVSYKWWLQFNRLLLRVANANFSDYGHLFESIKDDIGRIDHQIPFFPDIIGLPSLKGEQGIMTINKATRNNMFLPSINSSLDLWFYDHDFDHAESGALLSIRQKLINNLLYDYLRENAQKISDQKKKIYEVILFYLSHEFDMNHPASPQQLKRLIMEIIPPDIMKTLPVAIKLIKFPEALPRQARQIEQMAEDFAELAAKANEAVNEAISEMEALKENNKAVQPQTAILNFDLQAQLADRLDKKIEIPMVFPKYSADDFAKLYNLAVSKDSLAAMGVGGRVYTAEDFMDRAK